MKEVFNKGQLIPKRLKLLSCDAKIRHRMAFGCKVEFDHLNRTLRQLSPDGPVIFCKGGFPSIKMPNGTMKKKGVKGFNLTNIEISLAGVNNCRFVQGEGKE